MKTKERILEKSRKLFNAKGIRAVSLRNIAKSLAISYGNLTYHYSSKENLLTWIYIQMMEEQQLAINQLKSENNLLEGLLGIPENTFEISYKYLFIFQDYVEILRNYPSIAEMQGQINSSGKSEMLDVLFKLQEQGLFREDVGELEMDYLIERSIDLKSFYFMSMAGNSTKSLYKKANSKEYASFINNLLYPYLTAAGLKAFREYVSNE